MWHINSSDLVSDLSPSFIHSAATMLTCGISVATYDDPSPIRSICHGATTHLPPATSQPSQPIRCPSNPRRITRIVYMSRRPDRRDRAKPNDRRVEIGASAFGFWIARTYTIISRVPSPRVSSSLVSVRSWSGQLVLVFSQRCGVVIGSDRIARLWMCVSSRVPSRPVH